MATASIAQHNGLQSARVLPHEKESSEPQGSDSSGGEQHGEVHGVARPQDPAALRRRLMRELRRYRSEAGKTQKDVAEAMDWSPSKVIRIESGAVAVSTNDLRVLLPHYGVTEQGVVEELIQLAKDSKRSTTWNEYRDVISQQAATYFGYEASASIIRQYEPQVVPGLLQTEEYARTLLSDMLGFPKEKVERQWQIRQERQEILDRDELPEMFFILDEAVLRREFGGAKTMARQWERLEELARHPRISIQVISFARGAYPGLAGPFILLEFTDDDTVLYLESRIESVTRDDPEEIGRYLDIFQGMEHAVASKPGELPAIIKKIKAGGPLEVMG
jgi:transcriptional regulator with XRE-family HTH domain